MLEAQQKKERSITAIFSIYCKLIVPNSLLCYHYAYYANTYMWWNVINLCRGQKRPAEITFIEYGYESIKIFL